MISFQDWEKAELKVGQIKEVKDHPNADKLYVLTVDMGDKKITLVAGIKVSYTKEELKNKQIIVISNLEPRSLRGITSEGMLLAADAEGKPIILTPDKKVTNGSKIR